MAKRTQDEDGPKKAGGAAVDGRRDAKALPESAALALEKLRRLDSQLAARYEKTRSERRKRLR
ncbi:hypothetical protein [Ramlibacter pinisoli]|uniref:hypothetical protein n=1 Tax=Ramlibacter pinisoli TaxID=2682844 RepID=UPI0018E0360B|nr:hypothetical protein [Ramlibacter pinisoli]